MTRLTRGVGTALSAFALILALVPPHAGATGSSAWSCQWGMYGGNPDRAFAYTCASGINRLTAPTLIPAWAYKTPGTVTASPVVVGGGLFVGDWTGTMYALTADKGELIWKYQTSPAPGAAFGPIVSSAAVADVEIDGRPTRLVIFGSGPRLYALTANTGSPTTPPQAVWIADFGQIVENPARPDPTEIESSPVVWNGRVYVGMDTHDRPASQVGDCEGTTDDTPIPCVGGLLVLDAVTGDLIWKFDPELGITIGPTGVPTSPPPADRPHTGCGGIWGSPTLDTATATVYFGTANCQSDHPDAWNTPHAEAITALDANTGAVKWTFQPHEDFNHKDWDFGATPNLFVDAAGNKVLGAGNKDGFYYALHADDGKQLWPAAPHVGYGDAFGDDFAIGGFIGSPAVARLGTGTDEKVFVVGGTAIAPPLGEEGIKGYYHAIDAADGSNPWIDPLTGQIPTGGLGGPSYAASATVNGVAFSGALDNLFKAYDAETGAILWTTPLLGPISSGPAIAGDWVYVGSGTSSSDLCAKDAPGSEACLALFDTILGGLGGIHAFRLPPVPSY